MKIGIINAGNIGRTLAQPWHQAGHQLMLSKQGTQKKLDQFLPQIQGATKGTPQQVAEFGEVVLFSVYWQNVEEVLAQVGDLAGKIVIDTINPLKVNEKFEHTHDLEFMANNSTSELLQQRLPNARVVKAFSTMPAVVLDEKQWSNNPVKPAIFIAGDDRSAKEVVAQLAKDAGFTGMDAGSLANGRYIEQMGVLLHHIGTHHFDGDYSRLAPTFLRAS